MGWNIKSSRINLITVILFSLIFLVSCSGPLIDLSPKYEPTQFVVPENWHGAAPFREAQPAEAEARGDWWKVFNDPLLDKFNKQALEENPDLQAAAERFMQARYEMMKVRAGYMPQIGIGGGVTSNKQSQNSLFIAPGEPLMGTSMTLGGGASWEPDFWSAIRNASQAQIYRAEEVAANYALARLLLQAELAHQYFTLRGLDAQNFIYKQSIEYYKTSLEIVKTQYHGKIASMLDVARAEYILFNTQAKQLNVEANRQIVEHAIAILLNRTPTSFSIEPVGTLTVKKIEIPKVLPSVLLERRPDIAGLERRMAQANRAIGVAKAAFFPNINLKAGAGYENGSGFNFFNLLNSFWSYGSLIELPLFRSGYRRAQLQQSWSVYRETLNHYRSGVLNAFREVENSLSQVDLFTQEMERQGAAVKAAMTTQTLSMDLFKGGLASSLDLIYAQLNTLEARVREAQVKMSVLVASVSLIRSLGGGWDRTALPKDDEIQPFSTLQYKDLDKPKPAGGIEKSQPDRFLDLVNGPAAGIVAEDPAQEGAITQEGNEKEGNTKENNAH